VLEKIEGIVLRNIKYSDNSLIIHIYTRKLGRISCMVKKARNKKTGFAPSFFQPFNILQVEIYYNPKKEIYPIKEVNLLNSFADLTTDSTRLAIRMFLTEIMNKCIRYQHTDEEMYEFLTQSVVKFSEQNESPANFHLYFMIELSRFLGFYPVNNYSKNEPIFDLLNASFVSEKMGSQTLSTELSFMLHQFLNLESGNWWEIPLNSTQRRQLIDGLLNFYTIHTGSNMNLKSLEVFSEIFN